MLIKAYRRNKTLCLWDIYCSILSYDYHGIFPTSIRRKKRGDQGRILDIEWQQHEWTVNMDEWLRQAWIKWEEWMNLEGWIDVAGLYFVSVGWTNEGGRNECVWQEGKNATNKWLCKEEMKQSGMNEWIRWQEKRVKMEGMNESGRKWMKISGMNK
jgi:hypothetical protein